MSVRCFCGCGARAVQQHHVIYRQELRRHGSKRLYGDRRNLVPVAHACHGAHHARSAPFAARLLPDAVFEFAVELMGAGAAFEYLSRRYAGRDPRLDALLS